MNAPNPQNVAADPRASIFVTANAGSGKTSTLVNRVARLLLDGAAPEKVLCVTYTKAAAAEMQSRLFARLGDWAVMDDARLSAELEAISEGGRDLAYARALFARALETPGGLKIQTIHAFCEKLLRRFPLEAGLSPAFQVLDDLKGRELSLEAIEAVLTDAVSAPVRDRLIRLLKPSGFEKLMGQFILSHDAILAASRAFAEAAPEGDWASALFTALGLDGVTSPEALDRALFERLDWDAIADLARALASVDKTSAKNAEVWMALRENWLSSRVDAEAFLGLFYTGKWELRAKFYTNPTATADKLLIDRLATLAIDHFERRNAARIGEQTRLTLSLFAVFSEMFTDLKRRTGALDFADLISRACALVATRSQVDWVLYKLDQGLQHILVDEAQDTSEDQWRIVKALSEAFFDGGDDAPRTVFAVGDEKQSIYGFQGARPDRFLEARQYFSLRAKAADMRFVVPELITSYRSLPHILNFVDAVFTTGDLSYALNFSSEDIRHAAHRDGRGLVELWPQVNPAPEPPEQAETDTDTDEDAQAVDATLSSPAQRLAQQIAGHVAEDIRLGRAVPDRKAAGGLRAMHAGDVLILVRKRGALFEHIIRELKLAGVAVSGADRLKLSGHIAFEDLRALLRVCLQPKDDLSLATVLRSPLCDISEDMLFGLCQTPARLEDMNRSPGLWRVLASHPEDNGPMDDARAFIGWAIEASQRQTAFDFLNAALNRRDSMGLSQRQRFLTRLGPECEDVLDETLGLAQMAEGAGRVSLSAFLDLCEFNASEIKRDQEEGGHRVRVMTVHGSKGLEAPWVILPTGPDYGSARMDDLLMIAEPDGVPGSNTAPPELYLRAGSKALDPQHLRELKARATLKADQEALRLFYVALTRARDRLTLCGYLGKRAGQAGSFGSWYDLAAQAFQRLPEPEVTACALTAYADFAIEGAPDPHRIEVLRYGEPMPVVARTEAVHRERPPLPPFGHSRESGPEAVRNLWRSVSHLGDEDRSDTERAPSPLATGTKGLGRYRRGLLIHKLFEMLPETAPDRRSTVASAYLAKQPGLDADIREDITQSVMSVFDDPRFAEAFGEGSRPEVAIAGEIAPGLRLSGRIDRLVVTPTRVLVVDLKSNRPAPDRAEDAPVDYQRQMAGYVALLRKVYPDRPVEAALLWTDGPKLTPLSETLVNLRLSEVMTD